MVSEVDRTCTLSADQVKQASTQRSSGPNIAAPLDMDAQFMVPSTMIVNPAGSFGHYGAGGRLGGPIPTPSWPSPP